MLVPSLAQLLHSANWPWCLFIPFPDREIQCPSHGICPSLLLSCSFLFFLLPFMIPCCVSFFLFPMPDCHGQSVISLFPPHFQVHASILSMIWYDWPARLLYCFPVAALLWDLPYGSSDHQSEPRPFAFHIMLTIGATEALAKPAQPFRGPMMWWKFPTWLSHHKDF